MANVYLLVAQEHRSSREVLAAAVKLLRPELRVIALDPQFLDAALLRLRPPIVICSYLTVALEASRSDWIMLYPGGERRVELRLTGVRGSVEDLDFDVLLGHIDRAVAGRLYAATRRAHFPASRYYTSCRALRRPRPGQRLGSRRR